MKNPTDDFLPEITPLETIKEYEDLSAEERALRQASVQSYFVSLAINHSSRIKKNTDFLLNEVDDYKSIGNYAVDSEAAKHKEIRLARKLVEADDLCGTVLDRLVSFSITAGNIEDVKDIKLLTLLNKWKEGIGNLYKADGINSSVAVMRPQGLGIVFEQVVERLFVDGDSFISEIWAEDVIIDGTPFILPQKIKIHDTLMVEYPDDSFVKKDLEMACLNVSTSSYTLTKKEQTVPLYAKGTGQPFTMHLKLRPKTFLKWGTSYFKRAFHPVASKKRIEALEVNTVEGLINRLTILKAGKIDVESESGIIAPHRLAILERLISQPKINNLILWPGDDISVEDIGPNTDLLTYEGKYKEANQQILAALGFPRVLIDGEGSSTENWQKFLGLISFIDSVRNNQLIPWINQILRKIAVRNGFEDEYPKFSFTRVKLYDLKELLNAVKVFYDRGLMSELSAMTSGDLNYDVEQSRRRYEQDFGIITQYGGPKDLPFSKNSQDGASKEGMNSPEKNIDTKDKVEASIKDPSREGLVNVFNVYLEALHNSYSKKLVASTKNKHFDRVDDIMFVYQTHMKRDIKRQMSTLFKEEVFGKKIEDDYLQAAIEWIDGFVDGFFVDMKTELNSAVESNKENRASVIPDLIAGIMASFRTKRLRMYSSSVYNKAKVAGQLTELRASGTETLMWQSTLSDKACDFCKTMHGSVLTSNDFFSQFPPHPDCECWGVTSETSITNNFPEKDPNNWGKIR